MSNNNEKNNLKNSFSSANADLPVKILKHELFSHSLRDGVIKPVHLQWMPTNRCDQNCSFCSCSKRDKNLELDIDISREAIELFSHLGARAVTITGGGEPMLYSHIYELFEIFTKNNIEIGLVTNGKQFMKLWEFNKLKYLRWIRMSISDEYEMLNNRESFFKQINYIVSNLKQTDFALSYVVTDKPDVDKMRIALSAVTKFNLSHIRFVLNILDSDKYENEIEIQNHLNVFPGMDTSRAIFQTRRNYEIGEKECWICLAKPVIGADGGIYPCCGVQYAASSQSLDLPLRWKMGELKDVEHIWRHQWPFDGTNCVRCYYNGYNRVLAAVRADVRHVNFI